MSNEVTELIHLLQRYSPKFGDGIQSIKDRYEQEARQRHLSEKRKEKNSLRLAEVLDHSIEE